MNTPAAKTTGRRRTHTQRVDALVAQIEQQRAQISRAPRTFTLDGSCKRGDSSAGIGYKAGGLSSHARFANYAQECDGNASYRSS